MKSNNNFCPFGRSTIKALVVSGALAFSIQCQATVGVVLTDQNSTAMVALDSAAGMYHWSVDGQNQLNQQWFYYRVGNSGVAQAINAISPSSYVTYNANEVTATYANAQLSVSINYILSGGLSGSGTASILESISVHNNSDAPLDLHFFQYSDFDLGGTPGGDSIAISGSPGPGFNYVNQTKGPGMSIGEAIVNPFATRAETDNAFNTLTSLTGISGYNLNNNLSSGPGNVTWALQWDANVAIGADFDVFKGKRLAIVPIPEPSSLALIALGAGALGLVRRRRV
jgi:hypothetical protein